MGEPTIRDLAIEADSHLSVIVHRYPGGLPDDLLAEMRATAHGLRDWYESAESRRYAGGFPITPEAIVAHAKAFGYADQLAEMLEADDE